MYIHGNANRGMALEQLIRNMNQHYKYLNIAVVDKIATPVKVCKRIGNRITLAFFEEQSTVDFVGIIKDGRHIAFDTKETKADKFSLRNIKNHQYKYLERVHNMQGISFLLIWFTSKNKFIRLSFPVIKDLISKSSIRGHASVKCDELLDYEITSSKSIAVDYLAGLY